MTHKPCLLLLALLLTSGCETFTPAVKTPRTDLSLRAGDWKLDLDAQKDTRIDSLAVGVTNGPVNVTVVMTGFVSTNSPVVITRTGEAQRLTLDGQGNVIDATGKAVGNVGELVVKGLTGVPVEISSGGDEAKAEDAKDAKDGAPPAGSGTGTEPAGGDGGE